MRANKTDPLRGWGTAVLRVVTGYLFLNAGAHKLFFSAQHLGELGGSLPAPLVAAAALVELVCGAALAAGLLTR